VASHLEKMVKRDGGAFSKADIDGMMDRFGYSQEMRAIIRKEKLLPAGLMSRLHHLHPEYSDFKDRSRFLFSGKNQYVGLKGFREITAILKKAGIEIGFIKERELFIKVYRFMATRHVLNAINWGAFARDPLFQLVFPQPGMIRKEATEAYLAAKTAAERKAIVDAYMEKTNPHDGKQKLNMPWFENDAGETELVMGSQHKYPQCQLIFDKTTQNCFAFCTYCFRHAQVRGDEDMFSQEDVGQVHRYLRAHKEVTDLLITGGDAGYLTAARLEEYAGPILEDPSLFHIRTIRIGSRALTYFPELILSPKYDRMLALFERMSSGGVQPAWMAHFCTPREVLNPSTIAAIRRLQAHGVVVRSQSPIMNHVSLFYKSNGEVDVDRSAQNWIDLGNIFSNLHIGFHSMYCARPTGEHHYFTAPLADINKVFRKIYRSLASINRPSRHISMTSSAGKVSILGTAEVGGKKAFALAFTEGRNMAWLDRVFLGVYDEKENTVAHLTPFDTPKFFFEDELAEIEKDLQDVLRKGCGLDQ
jgi:lysine 2,3-aminomutase